MANNDAQSVGDPAMDYEEQEKTCRYLQQVKYSIAGVAVVVALLA